MFGGLSQTGWSPYNIDIDKEKDNKLGRDVMLVG
jgi:hypothetical protein